ncbi:MAG: hypothetical protein JW956_07290 [Calditrichaceae bacterium]|nr:hypothetical protein [Calditrichaceae bacterium]
MQKSKSIQLPVKLIDELRLHLKRSSFKSVNDFIIYILQNYLDQQSIDSTAIKSSEEDDAEVMKRLQDLGYM